MNTIRILNERSRQRDEARDRLLIATEDFFEEVEAFFCNPGTAQERLAVLDILALANRAGTGESRDFRWIRSVCRARRRIGENIARFRQKAAQEGFMLETQGEDVYRFLETLFLDRVMKSGETPPFPVSAIPMAGTLFAPLGTWLFEKRRLLPGDDADIPRIPGLARLMADSPDNGSAAGRLRSLCKNDAVLREPVTEGFSRPKPGDTCSDGWPTHEPAISMAGLLANAGFDIGGERGADNPIWTWQPSPNIPSPAETVLGKPAQTEITRALVRREKVLNHPISGLDVPLAIVAVLAGHLSPEDARPWWSCGLKSARVLARVAHRPAIDPDTRLSCWSAINAPSDVPALCAFLEGCPGFSIPAEDTEALSMGNWQPLSSTLKILPAEKIAGYVAKSLKSVFSSLGPPGSPNTPPWHEGFLDAVEILYRGGSGFDHWGRTLGFVKGVMAAGKMLEAPVSYGLHTCSGAMRLLHSLETVAANRGRDGSERAGLVPVLEKLLPWVPETDLHGFQSLHLELAQVVEPECTGKSQALEILMKLRQPGLAERMMSPAAGGDSQDMSEVFL